MSPKSTGRFVSHRGAAGLAPENSLEAIRIGDSYKPTYIEVDIHRTRDGVFVMYHGSLKRTYLGTELDETYDQLKGKIPTLLTLEEFINEAPRRPYMIDVKIKTSDHELIAALKPMPQSMRTLFTSPHHLTLSALKKAFPDAKTLISQPYTEGPVRPIELARQYGFSGVSLNKWWLGPFLLKMCHFYKLEIVAYTVDRTSTMRLINRLFPNVTICTNHPERYPQLKRRESIGTGRETPKASTSTSH